MGGACSKGPSIAPKEEEQAQQAKQGLHKNPQQAQTQPSPFEKVSSSAVVQYAASEPDVDDVVVKKGGRLASQSTQSRASGNGTQNPLAHGPAGQSSDNLSIIPGAPIHAHSNLSPTSGHTKTGPRQQSSAPGQVLSVPSRRCTHAVTQTDDDWLDWLTYAAALEARAPTMPAAWKKGGSIGSGSFGTVFLALNNDTGELLAVKEVALGGVSKDQEAVEQLEHEVAVLSSLRHPNIVTYVGTVRQGDTLLIFLEYVPGGSIASLLTRFGPLAEAAIRSFTRQLLEGLAYLHAQRTVHRDIKGANLLVETSGHVKLADFGMAKQMVEAASFTQSFKGSAFWMAPEVIRQQGYGVAADIWSLGCTVLEMATGKPPWAQCTTQVQAIFKIASSGELPTIPQSLSPQASEFILLCLQRDPSRRPSAESLLQHPWIRQDGDRPVLPRALNGAQGTWRQVAHAHAGRVTAGGGGGGGGGITRKPMPITLALDASSGVLSRPTSSRPTAVLQSVMNGGQGPGSGGHTPSEGEMSDALAAMVLGSNMKRSTANRRGGPKSEGGVNGVDAASGTDGLTSLSQVEEIDFTAKPSTFKVQGLLTLPPLKTLAGGALPTLQLQQQFVRPAISVSSTHITGAQ